MSAQLLCCVAGPSTVTVTGQRGAVGLMDPDTEADDSTSSTTNIPKATSLAFIGVEGSPSTVRLAIRWTDDRVSLCSFH
jgi:hypothetical protein